MRSHLFSQDNINRKDSWEVFQKKMLQGGGNRNVPFYAARTIWWRIRGMWSSPSFWWGRVLPHGENAVSSDKHS